MLVAPSDGGLANEITNETTDEITIPRTSSPKSSGDLSLPSKRKRITKTSNPQVSVEDEYLLLRKKEHKIKKKKLKLEKKNAELQLKIQEQKSCKRAQNSTETDSKSQQTR